MYMYCMYCVSIACTCTCHYSLPYASPLAAVLDERKAVLVTRYLASSRALTRSFDVYLQKVRAGVHTMHVHVHVLFFIDVHVLHLVSVLNKPFYCLF